MKNIETSKRKTIKEWPEEQRPREKLLKHGSKALSNAELIAILLGSGTTKYSAIELAQLILEKADYDLHKLIKLSFKELDAIKGIGTAKAIQLKAAFELGVRLTQNVFLNIKEIKQYESFDNQAISQNVYFEHKPNTTQNTICKGKKPIIKNSLTAYNFLLDKFIFERTEVFLVVLLNNKNEVLCIETISSGGFGQTYVDMKKIFITALEHKASRLIVCHNHPSGDPVPSDADLTITKKISSAAKQLDMELLDHIIFGKETYYSFLDNNTLD